MILSEFSCLFVCFFSARVIHHTSTVFCSLFAYKLGYGEWESVHWLLPAAMQPSRLFGESESVISPDPALLGRLAPPLPPPLNPDG